MSVPQASFEKIVVRVLLACHNRVKVSRALMESLAFIARESRFVVEVFAVDDGSIDGTSEMLQSLPFVIQIHLGGGNLFWAKSMEIAEMMALREPLEPKNKYMLLWLNDDVQLFPEQVINAFETCLDNPLAIWVGATQGSAGQQSYGGFLKTNSWIHPLAFSRTAPSSQPTKVDTFNGNFVLYDVILAEKIGPIDGRFSHSLADIDYGLRATKAGVPIYQLPEYVGVCNRNPEEKFNSLGEAWASFLAAKGGGNFLSLKIILKKHSNFWAMQVMAVYGFWWLERVRQVLKNQLRKFSSTN